MTTLHLKAIVTPQKQIIVDLPDDVQPGEEVEITVQLPESPFTDEEIHELIALYRNPQPITGDKIAAFLQTIEPGYSHIEDSAAWVEEQRSKPRQGSAW